MADDSLMKICYEGDSLECAGWENGKSESGVYELQNGTLYMADTLAGEFQPRLLSKWNCNFDLPVTIEARAKVERCDEIGGCGIYFGDGIVSGLLTLYSDGLKFSDFPEVYKADTTDDFHDYKIEIAGGKASVYFDGKFALECVLQKHECADKVGFGGFGHGGAGWWDYFRVSYHKRMPLVGGCVSFDNLNIVRTDGGPLNFEFAKHFSDGTIWLGHSMGQHMIDERKASLWSFDDGKSWSKPETKVMTLDTCELPDKSVIAFSGWDREQRKKHIFTVTRWANPRSSDFEEKEIEIELPVESSMLVHRSLILLGSGRLLACAYGKLTTGDLKHGTFIFASDDNGESWKYLSMIAGGSPGTEGYGEPCLVELADGSVLCLVRTGGSLNEWITEENCGPLLQMKSANGGESWSEPTVIWKYGVNPHAIRLADGTLVAASGRPGIYLLVDFTGTGEHWQKVDVYLGCGSSYVTLAEVEAGKVIMLYDESPFCLGKSPFVLNRIMRMEMTIKKDA